MGNAWDEFKDFNFEPVSFYHELLVKLDFPFQSTTTKKRTICERQCSTCFIKYYMFLTFPLQILHTLGKITENEIWQDEKENMVNIFSMI